MSKRYWAAFTSLFAIVAWMWVTPGCGRAQQLETIEIQPSTEIFGNANTPVPDDAGASVQLRALGNFSISIHQ